MAMTTKAWVAVPLALGLLVAACNDDGGDDADPTAEAAATAAPTAESAGATDAPSGGQAAATGVLLLGDEEIPIGDLRCFFEEQERAGLGGVFTHTAQAQGTNAAGEPVVLDMTRARDEDGTVGDDLTVDIGDPFSDDAYSYRGTGPEGTIEFGDSSAAATDLEVTSFDVEPGTLTVTFDLPCR